MPAARLLVVLSLSVPHLNTTTPPTINIGSFAKAGRSGQTRSIVSAPGMVSRTLPTRHAHRQPLGVWGGARLPHACRAAYQGSRVGKFQFREKGVCYCYCPRPSTACPRSSSCGNSSDGEFMGRLTVFLRKSHFRAAETTRLGSRYCHPQTERSTPGRLCRTRRLAPPMGQSA